MFGLDILYIDDEELLLRAFQRQWGDLNLVTIVSSGKEALNLLLQDREFDIVVCDIMLADTTGVDLFGEVTKLKPEVAKKFIFVSGGYPPALAPQLPTNPFVHKPWSRESLTQAFRVVLNGSSGVDTP